MCIIVQDFVETGRTVAEISQFNGVFFSKRRPFATLGFISPGLDHPRRAFAGLYHCAN